MSHHFCSRFLGSRGWAAACLTLLAACSHGSHSHATDQHAPESAELEAIGITVFSAQHLLYCEFEPVIRGEEARFLAHFSRLEDGEPVRSGRAVLETIGSDGVPVRVAANALARDGLFIPIATFDTVGALQASMRLETERGSEEFDLGVLEVHPDAAAAAASPAAPPHPTDAFPFLLE